ncbi:MAG: hypothetical protein V4723_01260 [Pseudomonadota bacterium]
MSQQNSTGAISAPRKELIRGTLIAAVVAGIVLTVAVLPAEYGIDPTGAGKALGLTVLNAPAATSAPAVAPAAVAATATPAPSGSTVSAPGETRTATIASKQTVPYRADTQEITLPPGKGLEVKTILAKGATLIFSWKTENGELVNHDFHGEPVNAKNDEFESFIDEKRVSQSSGSLIAPFTGVHGWYWKNTTTVPVKITLQASGFYSEIYKK